MVGRVRVAQTRQHVCDRICHCHTWPVAFLELVSIYLMDLLRSCWIKKLPASFCDARKFTAVCHFAEADTADAELLVDSVWTTTTLATGIAAYLKFRFASCLYLERCLCHLLCLPEWKTERFKKCTTFVIVFSCCNNGDVHTARTINFVLFDFREYNLFG